MIRLRQSTAMMTVYLAAVAVFFFAVGIAILNDELPYQFYADSVTYERMAAGELDAVEGESLISVGANYLGPLLLLKAVDSSRVAILAINMLVFLAGFAMLTRFVAVDRRALLVTLAANPMTFSSLLSVNKEIIAYIAMCLLVGYVFTRKWRWLLPSLVLSILSRWQLTAFVLAGALSVSCINPLRRRPAATLLLGVLLLTLIYPQVSDIVGAVSENAASGALEGDQSGIYQQMVQLQEHYAYVLVVIPKTLQGMFGIIGRIDNFGDPEDFYNMVVVMLHAVALAALFACLILMGRFRLSDPLIFLSLVFCLLFSLSPVYAPRYYYPVYLLWACALARSPQPRLIATTRAPAAIESTKPL